MPAKVHARRFFRIILPAATALLVGTVSGFAYLTYRITHPAAVLESVNPSHYLLPSKDVYWNSPEGGQVSGWWIPGVKGAAGILLVPGYGMSRSDCLSLAAVLNQNGFNILTYDAPGSGAVPRGVNSLGLREVKDMMAALNYLKSRPGVNMNRLGIWGVDVSARAALQAAAALPEVRAVAADSAYDRVEDFIGAWLREDLGWDNKVLELGCRHLFRLYMRVSTMALQDRLPIQPLEDRSVLFIKGENRKEFARLTTALYDRFQPQKELVTIPVSRTRLMNTEELKSYDRQVVNFFHLNLQ